MKNKANLVGIIALGLSFAATLAILGCPDGNTQEQPGPETKVLADGPTMTGGDIKFTINPKWTNDEAVKAVNQALRHMTTQSNEINKIASDWYDIAKGGGPLGSDKRMWAPSRMHVAEWIMNFQEEMRGDYAKSNIAEIKQKTGGNRMADWLDHGWRAPCFQMLYKVNYITSRTKATPVELATAQAEVDALIALYNEGIAEYNAFLEREKLYDEFLENMPETNIIPWLKEDINSRIYNGYVREEHSISIVYDSDSSDTYSINGWDPIYPPFVSVKLIQQFEDYGQFLAFADDLIAMGYTLENLSNRSLKF